MGLVVALYIVSTVRESRRECKKEVPFESSVTQIEEGKDGTLDLAVWRLLKASEKVVTVICFGAEGRLQ